jgi:hypothetical protein
MLFPSIETGMDMNARESENYLPISRSFMHQNKKQFGPRYIGDDFILGPRYIRDNF